jgi:hypothetical protein
LFFFPYSNTSSLTNQLLFTMRSLIFLLLLIPAIGISQDDKNVINVTRVFPKIDKVAEFEKAILAHAQKYHTGDWKWRVSEIMSGPDAGGFSIIEGPHTWDQVDKRGDLGAEHQSNWNKTIAIHLTDKYQASFVEYKPEYSTTGLTDYSDKYVINHVFIKPGTYNIATAVLADLKKMWEASKQNIAVYESSASGAPQIVIVTRYKDGLKERQAGVLKPMTDRYEAANGAGSFQKYIESSQKTVDHSWQEILITRADLSSK